MRPPEMNGNFLCHHQGIASYYKKSAIVWKVSFYNFFCTSRTLSCYFQEFKCGPGIIPEVIQVLKDRVKDKDVRFRLCGLVYDEMSVNAQTVHDTTFDKVVSASKAQVCIVRGIVENWKQE